METLKEAGQTWAMLDSACNGEKGDLVLDVATPAVFVKTQSSQCFTAPLILLCLHPSQVLTLYGDMLLLCTSSKQDVSALKPSFVACRPFLEIC